MANGYGPTSSMWALLMICSILAQCAAGKSHLREGFYHRSCPMAEDIVSQVVASSVSSDHNLAAGLVRLSFHDCFVRGCDASILLDATPTGEPIEKLSKLNGGTLRGLMVIDEAKAILEQLCPGKVSCSDILTFAARDAAVQAGLPTYTVASGRRDGRTSLASEVSGNLPTPHYTIDQLIDLFSKKGFSPNDLVVLSGAHSIGMAGCNHFKNRLYNFSASLTQDPSLDPAYANYLKRYCGPTSWLPLPIPGPGPPVLLDPISSYVLDNAYYVVLRNGRGLLASDQALMTNPSTRKMVEYFSGHPKQWAYRFGKAMAKLSTMDVLTGDQGEVRRLCRFVN